MVKWVFAYAKIKSCNSALRLHSNTVFQSPLRANLRLGTPLSGGQYNAPSGRGIPVPARTYSVRNAVIGFTRVARRAGRKQASNAAAASNTLEMASANGSAGLT